MPPSSQNFSDLLVAARERRGLSQAELASQAGFEPSAISHFESGRRAPSFENLRRLADALEVSTDYLLGRATDPSALGPTATRLFRCASNVTHDDLEHLADIAEMLAKKNRKHA